MNSPATQRMPGFRFEAQPPPLKHTLPRMDIPVFVGFAASGPLHRPVPVEDAVQFSSIFGGDLPLAWDDERGEPVSACLAPTVISFFRNGGARCWIIRVADEATARYNMFPIPGLLRSLPDAQHGVQTLVPAFARARSEGSWSDDIRVGSALDAEPQRVIGHSLEEHTIDLELNPLTAVVAGDLLRLGFGDSGQMAFLVVESVGALPDGSPPAAPGSQQIRVKGKTLVWFDTGVAATPPAASFAKGAYTYNSSRTGSPEPKGCESERIPVIDMKSVWNAETNRHELVLDLNFPISEAPEPGSFVRIDCGDLQLYLCVRTVGQRHPEGSPSIADVVTLAGEALGWMKFPPVASPTYLTTCEKLSFDLSARDKYGVLYRMSGLGFGADNPRCWDRIPVDTERYLNGSQNLPTREPLIAEATGIPPFPLAGNGAHDSFFLPVAMSLVPSDYLACVQSTSAPLERDGLAIFDARLFLDPDLAEVGSADLLQKADFLRSTNLQPRDLRGIHAALPIDEATLIAVPDAAAREWQEVLAPADDQLFRHPPPGSGLGDELGSDAHGDFLKCENVFLPPPPSLSILGAPSSAGTRTFTLEWSATGDSYILEESLQPDFGGATSIYKGKETQFVIYSRVQGNYYYHVRAKLGDVAGEWSNGIHVRIAPDAGYQCVDTAHYRPDTLLAIHRALVRMASARGDFFAVLSGPAHYHAGDLITYAATLSSASGPPVTLGNARVSLLLAPGERGSWSYAGMYHPWLVTQEERTGIVRTIPPDGAACGVIARRSLDRGAWIAPANEALKGVVALSMETQARYRLPLQSSGINVFLQQPQGFVSQSAVTMSDDPDLQPIGVRRLLTLIRRLAMRLGVTYVFEPNDESSRRLVQRSFESMLGQMFLRGAFAGSTPASAYQVVTGAEINPPGSVDVGRFFVELRIAPSLPLTFMAIRLVQTGDRAFISESS